MTARIWSAIFIATAAAVFTTGCKKRDAAHGAAGPAGMPAPVVSFSPVQQQEVVEWEEFTGRTAAIENVEVRPRVSGHIEAVKFQSGQLVKKGDVLFQIDPRWHQADFDRRAAEYEQARVKLANAEREEQRSAA